MCFVALEALTGAFSLSYILHQGSLSLLRQHLQQSRFGVGKAGNSEPAARGVHFVVSAASQFQQ